MIKISIIFSRDPGEKGIFTRYMRLAANLALGSTRSSQKWQGRKMRVGKAKSILF